MRSYRHVGVPMSLWWQIQLMSVCLVSVPPPVSVAQAVSVSVAQAVSVSVAQAVSVSVVQAVPVVPPVPVPPPPLRVS